MQASSHPATCGYFWIKKRPGAELHKGTKKCFDWFAVAHNTICSKMVKTFVAHLTEGQRLQDGTTALQDGTTCRTTDEISLQDQTTEMLTMVLLATLVWLSHHFF
jgi:hypothetical protein